jgi:hypothetical protein
MHFFVHLNSEKTFYNRRLHGSRALFFFCAKTQSGWYNPRIATESSTN